MAQGNINVDIRNYSIRNNLIIAIYKMKTKSYVSTTVRVVNSDHGNQDRVCGEGDIGAGPWVMNRIARC